VFDSNYCNDCVDRRFETVFMRVEDYGLTICGNRRENNTKRNKTLMVHGPSWFIFVRPKAAAPEHLGVQPDPRRPRK